MQHAKNKIVITKSLQKYLLVGSAAFVIEYGSFYLLYESVHWALVIANSISFGLGLLTSFILNRMWTFGDKKYNKKATPQFGLYTGLALINLALTNLFVEILDQVSINPRIGKIVAMLVTSLWNYILFKTFIFTHHKNQSAEA